MTGQSNVVPLYVTTTEYFGGCPTCGKSDGYMNVGRSHYGSCGAHGVFWPIGSGLFSPDNEHDTEKVWRSNAQVLAGYRQVKPIYPPRESFAADGMPSMPDLPFDDALDELPF